MVFICQRGNEKFFWKQTGELINEIIAQLNEGIHEVLNVHKAREKDIKLAQNMTKRDLLSKAIMCNCASAKPRPFRKMWNLNYFQ